MPDDVLTRMMESIDLKTGKPLPDDSIVKNVCSLIVPYRLLPLIEMKLTKQLESPPAAYLSRRRPRNYILNAVLCSVLPPHQPGDNIRVAGRARHGVGRERRGDFGKIREDGVLGGFVLFSFMSLFHHKCI